MSSAEERTLLVADRQFVHPRLVLFTEGQTQDVAGQFGRQGLPAIGEYAPEDGGFALFQSRFAVCMIVLRSVAGISVYHRRVRFWNAKTGIGRAVRENEEDEAGFME